MAQVTIKISPQNETVTLELDPDTLISELFEFIQNKYRVNSNIQNWTCYSDFKRMNLSLQSNIGNIQNDTLIINTSHNARSQMMTPDSNLVNSSSNIKNNTNVQQFPAPIQQQRQVQAQTSITQQQQNQSQPQISNSNQLLKQNSGYSQNSSDLIILHLTITDGYNSRKFQSTFRSDDKLEDVGDAVLSYLGVSKEAASCDLIIFGQPYNSPEKRLKTLLQLSIQSNSTIDARLRWIGGSQH